MKRTMTLLAVVPLAFGLSACGGGKKGDDGIASAGGAAHASAQASPSRSLSPADAQLKFAQCMRQNGVNMPDPEPGQRGIRITQKSGDRAKVETAMKKCQGYLQAGGVMPDPNDPKMRDQMLKFAQCMRAHGVDVPDPQPGQDFKMQIPKGSKANFDAAQKACQSQLPGKGGK